MRKQAEKASANASTKPAAAHEPAKTGAPAERTAAPPSKVENVPKQEVASPAATGTAVPVMAKEERKKKKKKKKSGAQQPLFATKSIAPKAKAAVAHQPESSDVASSKKPAGSLSARQSSLPSTTTQELLQPVSSLPPATTSTTPSSTAPKVEKIPPSKKMAEEFRRSRAACKSRQALAGACANKLQIPVPPMAWERWQAVKKMLENTEDRVAGRAPGGGPAGDPLLPGAVGRSALCNIKASQRRDQERRSRSRSADRAKRAANFYIANLDTADLDLVASLTAVKSPAFTDHACMRRFMPANITWPVPTKDHRKAVEATVRAFRAESASLALLSTGAEEATQMQQNRFLISSEEQDLLTVEKHKTGFRYSYRNKTLKLSAAHREKLSTVWRIFGEGANGFNEAVFRVLLRYDAVDSSHRTQCSLPDAVFDILKNSLQTTFECFSSPLNCRRAPFCSAFPDVDRQFGSLGCFFDVFAPSPFKKAFPQGGSFQVTPPFFPAVMDAALGLIHAVLEDNDKDAEDSTEDEEDSGSEEATTATKFCKKNLPLLFTVIIPAWTSCAAFQRCTGSKFLVRPPILLAKKDHGYVSGAQHLLSGGRAAGVARRGHVEAPYDTAVFLLANQLGRDKYCCAAGGRAESWSEDFEKALRAAFAEGIPTEEEKLIRAKKSKVGGRGLQASARFRSFSGSSGSAAESLTKLATPKGGAGGKRGGGGYSFSEATGWTWGQKPVIKPKKRMMMMMMPAMMRGGMNKGGKGGGKGRPRF